MLCFVVRTYCIEKQMRTMAAHDQSVRMFYDLIDEVCIQLVRNFRLPAGSKRLKQIVCQKQKERVLRN